VVHGLAFLYLDGKLDTSTPEAVADRVRAAVLALVAVSQRRDADRPSGYVPTRFGKSG